MWQCYLQKPCECDDVGKPLVLLSWLYFSQNEHKIFMLAVTSCFWSNTLHIDIVCLLWRICWDICPQHCVFLSSNIAMYGEIIRGKIYGYVRSFALEKWTVAFCLALKFHAFQGIPSFYDPVSLFGESKGKFRTRSLPCACPRYNYWVYTLRCNVTEKRGIWIFILLET